MGSPRAHRRAPEPGAHSCFAPRGAAVGRGPRGAPRPVPPRHSPAQDARGERLMGGRRKSCVGLLVGLGRG